VQSMFVIWAAILPTKVIQYKIYIGLYKNHWIGNVVASELCPSCV